MKGQFFAVETVLTFALGIMVAIGVIALFHNYRDGAMDGIESDQVDMIHSQLVLGMDEIKSVDGKERTGNGSYSASLPDKLAGKEYSVRIEDELTVTVNEETYSRPINGFPNYNKSGVASGGDVTIFKEENEMVVRDQ